MPKENRPFGRSREKASLFGSDVFVEKTNVRTARSGSSKFGKIAQASARYFIKTFAEKSVAELKSLGYDAKTVKKTHHINSHYLGQLLKEAGISEDKLSKLGYL